MACLMCSLVAYLSASSGLPTSIVRLLLPLLLLLHLLLLVLLLLLLLSTHAKGTLFSATKNKKHSHLRALHAREPADRPACQLVDWLVLVSGFLADNRCHWHRPAIKARFYLLWLWPLPRPGCLAAERKQLSYPKPASNPPPPLKGPFIRQRASLASRPASQPASQERLSSDRR